MEHLYRRIELPITFEQYERLPRNSAYRYDYENGRALLIPRPKSFLCARDLNLPLPDAEKDVSVQPLTITDIPDLEWLYSNSMRNVQPFASLDDETARAATRQCLTETYEGKDGPIISTACFKAFARDEDVPVGGILITLVPKRMLTEPYAGMWLETPKQAIEQKLGVPHITWVFVHWLQTRHGIATTLLRSAIRALAEMGFEQLLSTFQMDNGPSALWHWRNDFRLLPQYSAFRKRKLVEGFVLE